MIVSRHAYIPIHTKDVVPDPVAKGNIAAVAEEDGSVKNYRGGADKVI